jgi:outer membrane protein OmpA-like peptidoglycan-associated protein
LVGHTDWYGTEEYNVLLSDKRCKAVQEYMAGSGLDAGSIETVARGEQGSVVDVAKDSAEAKYDRRVDIVKIK